jgi:hypothetical protein
MSESEERSRQSEHKRTYVPPKLETLGTIRDLTHGAGKFARMDNDHPPGQNKSSLT